MFNRLDRWIQIAGALGIIGGLVLVTLELQQSALLVRAELGSGSMAYRQTLLTSVQGEGLAEALAQALEDPAGLDAREQIILDAYYANVMGQILRQGYLLRLGVFVDPLPPFVAIQARTYFGNRYAQAWWRLHREGYPSEVVRMMDEGIAALAADRDRASFARLRAEAGGA